MSFSQEAWAEFLGSVPNDWKIVDCVNVLKELNIPGSSDLPLLSLTRERGLVLQSESGRRDVSNMSTGKYKSVARNNLVYNTMRMWQGVSAVSNLEGQVSPAYTVCQIDQEKADPQFLGLLFKTRKLVNLFHSLSQGIVDDTLSLKFSVLEKIAIPLPGIIEQKGISAVVEALSESLEMSNRALAQTRRLKKALLHQLLTKGIDENGKPHTRFKKTEIGEIPEEWEVVELADVSTLLVDCKNRTPAFSVGGFPVVRTTNVRDGRFVYTGLKYTDEIHYREWTRRGCPEPGDLLFTREAPAGEVCLVPSGLKACLGQRMMLIKLNKDLANASFVKFSLMGRSAIARVKRVSGGSTVGHLRVDQVRRFRFAIPLLGEQVRIAKLLNSLESAEDCILANIERQVSVCSSVSSDLLSGRVRVKDLKL